jgi:hypothetical protein
VHRHMDVKTPPPLSAHAGRLALRFRHAPPRWLVFGTSPQMPLKRGGSMAIADMVLFAGLSETAGPELRACQSPAVGNTLGNIADDCPSAVSLLVCPLLAPHAQSLP